MLKNHFPQQNFSSADELERDWNRNLTLQVQEVVIIIGRKMLSHIQQKIILKVFDNMLYVVCFFQVIF